MQPSPEGLENRYHLEEAANCKDCHKDLQFGSIREHQIHNNRVQCQVCHSQTYTNCYSCHTGTDENGIAYFINNLDFEDMKIGLTRTEPAFDCRSREKSIHIHRCRSSKRMIEQQQAQIDNRQLNIPSEGTTVSHTDASHQG